MELQVAPLIWNEINADWLLIPVSQPLRLSEQLLQLDQQLNGLLQRLENQNDLTGKIGNIVPVRGLSELKVSRLLFVGTGASDELKPGILERALITALRTITDQPHRKVAIYCEQMGSLPAEKVAEISATAAEIAGVGQDLFKNERTRHRIASLILVGQKPESLSQAAQQGLTLGAGINLTRELVNRPPMEITPMGFAQRATQVAAQYQLQCEIWDEYRLANERMNSLLAVAAGSKQPPRLVILTYQGNPKSNEYMAWVGKGVTFDSGGLSLKPTDGMLTMKCDMAGAATVLGAMSVVANQKIPVNIMGFMGLVENMPGGNAFKLGDILTARNGVTIEVLNTDAEGRLVLADVLSYAVECGVSQIIDLATLTGACVVALGEDVTGAFTNQQSWCDQVLQAAQQAQEHIWQLPMFNHYDELIKGEVGDIKNTGGRWGGAITAAKFLERFVGGKPWVHLDIAGPAFASANKPHQEGGATGCMVRTLVQLAKDCAGNQ